MARAGKIAGIDFRGLINILLGLCLLLWGFSGQAIARNRSISTSGWSLFKATHFNIHYRPGIDKAFIYKMKRYAEGYYRKIVQDLGLIRANYWVWDDRCDIYIYANKADYLNHVKTQEWSEGAAAVGKREIHCYYLADDQHLFDTVLPHEMTHLLFYEARQGKPVPHCIDEGVAMREEKDRKRVYISQYVVAKAFSENKYIPLERLFDWNSQYIKMDKETANLFYAESCLFIDFLLTRFPKNYFSTFCWRMKTGNDFYKAFRLSYPRFTAYGKIDMDKLNKEFIDYMIETNYYWNAFKKQTG